MQRLDIEFIQQFKEQEMTLPVIDQRHGNLCVRCFTNQKRDRRLLRKLIEKEMDQTHTVNELIIGLETEDLATTRRLIYCMSDLLEAFSADIRKEPYSARYYKSIPSDVLQLLKFLNSEENPHVVLYNSLNDLLVSGTSPVSRGRSCQKSISSLMTILKASCDTMCAQNEIFSGLVKQASAGKGKLDTTSRVGQRLVKISGLLVNLIVTTRYTLGRLAQWQELLMRRERQGIYN
ncbi:hypothetical protein Q4E93_13000 [Flavitalea sp. BT771]|uniref:hypothetical protein n=1 Tax=Flavitalea sp. BT771 TaxID=3063329 RepID=UPI0026E3424C|nr:hypothetical protein [Flavitalea sp. BT771]MDO6431515.1 hypothetical protein [Flavitalea sp. BT771]MDV6220423.1 hypothetical protein [Flavitalea sp. BT771]